jgi:hypothetical protein
MNARNRSTKSGFIAPVAVKPPLLLTESPYLKDTLRVGDLHPELEVVAVGIGRGGIPSHRHSAGAGGSAI